MRKSSACSVCAIAIAALSALLAATPAASQEASPDFKGLVAPARSYDIAPPFDGQVIKIHFVPGQFVEKGALLFTMDTTKEELDLERDQVVLAKTEAQLRIAEIILKNNTELRRKNVVAERQYLESEAQRDIAAATVAEARVQVKGDEVKIKELKRYAPFAGIMSRPTVAEGAHLIREARENTGMATPRGSPCDACLRSRRAHDVAHRARQGHGGQPLGMEGYACHGRSAG